MEAEIKLQQGGNNGEQVELMQGKQCSRQPQQRETSGNQQQRNL